MRHLLGTIVFIFASILCCISGRCFAATTPVAEKANTTTIFSRDKQKVVQVRIIDRVSNTKSVIGSGFFVGPEGLIVTNFHVISDLVSHPERVTAEIVRNDFRREPVKLRSIDIVHDLAVLKVASASPDYFEIYDGDTKKDGRLAHGDHIFAFGNPQDLGLTIVEGTYSGLLENSLYEKIHFTGSLNPGMSGGPAVTTQGKVVGVNVSTEGNQISFLVPAKFVAALVQTALQQPSEQPAQQFLRSAREQLLENQDHYIKALLANPFSRSTLSHCSLPRELTSAFKCWSRSEDKTTDFYRYSVQNCSVEDEIFISDNLSTGTLEFEHTLISTSQMNPFQFYTLYEQFFNRLDKGGLAADEEDVTNFECTSDFVDISGSDFLVAQCLRAYKRFAGIYDLVLLGAAVSENRVGLTTRLTLTGVSWENSQLFSKRYLNSVLCGTASS